MLNIKGIDLAYPQKNFNYKKAREEGYEYAIIKASQYNYLDTLFHTHAKGCAEAGFKVGFYHFFTNRGIVEAETFVNAIKNYTNDIIPIIDVEADWTYEGVKEFIDYVESNLGVECGIYCNYSYYKQIVKHFPGKKYWLAFYGSDELPEVNNIVGWQYSDKEYVAGINTDKNYFNEEILINKVTTQSTDYVGGMYKMAGKINMRLKYQENGVNVWTRWYDMDTESANVYKNITGVEIYTELPLKWGVSINSKYINVQGSGIIEGGEVYAFQAYMTDHSKKTYYWVSSSGDAEGYEWWSNNCKTENIPAVCTNTNGCSPLNAIKLRLGD